MSKEEVKLPKVELTEGEINYPEMIKKDFRKAMIIMGLTMLSAAITTVGLYLLAFFL